MATTLRSGAMPGKAIELLSFVASEKASACGGEPGVISAEDVEKFLANHPSFKQSPASASGKFKVIHNTGVRLNDVGGASQAKEVVYELLDFIKNPKKFEKTGAKMPKGALLQGTPGNGKTLLAKAIAGEAGIPFVSVSGSEFVEQYVGVGASRVRDLFEFARQQARSHDSKKAIVFIDEFDAIGKKRGTGGSGGSQEAEVTLNQLLVEMDGINNDNDVDVFVLAATNRPDMLSEAVTRPGRMDYKIDVPNPAMDPGARSDILRIHCNGKKLDLGEDFKTEKELLDDIATRTAGSSGAKLADIVNKAAIIAAKDNREAISFNDLLEAKMESDLGRPSTNPIPHWNKIKTVAHECGHALIHQVMNNIMTEEWQIGSEIDVISVTPRSNYLGVVIRKPTDNNQKTFPIVLNDIAMTYGGWMAQKEFIGMRGNTGVCQDLQQATSSAYRGNYRIWNGTKYGLNFYKRKP